MTEDLRLAPEAEANNGVTDISTSLNFIIGSIEYHNQRGMADEETLPALHEAFAEFHRLDELVRKRAQPEELPEWEQLIAYVEEKEQVLREIESSRESQG